MQNCYCGNDLTFNMCCQPIISGSQKPESPEQLMRSRYSAFCVKDVEYLLLTHHSSRQKTNEREQLISTFAHTQWLGLKVLDSSMEIPDQNVGQNVAYVEYLAFSKTDKLEQLHEKARFRFEDDTWYYLDGELLPSVKLGRNEPCFCGSNKKYKKCHGQ